MLILKFLRPYLSDNFHPKRDKVINVPDLFVISDMKTLSGSIGSYEQLAWMYVIAHREKFSSQTKPSQEIFVFVNWILYKIMAKVSFSFLELSQTFTNQSNGTFEQLACMYVIADRENFSLQTKSSQEIFVFEVQSFFNFDTATA